MNSRPETSTARSRDARRRSLRLSGVFRGIDPVHHKSPRHYPSDVLPLESVEIKDRLEALAEAFEELSENITQLEKMHNSVNGFNESFASFLYGFLITMYRTNLPGTPTREQYEEMMKSIEKQQEIAELKEQIRALKIRNAERQEELAKKQASASRPVSQMGSLFSQSPALKPKPLPIRSRIPISTHKRVQVARDDSFLSTDSFIEVPGLNPQAASATTSASSATPNLDQPPRYMRGLFDVPSSSNIKNRATNKPGTVVGKPTAMRAPLRAPVRRANPDPNTQKSQANSSREYAQRGISAAAQRAQRARQNRLTSRPPFR